MVEYFPERGDIVWLDFNPQLGKEIAKRRPAIVVSPKAYNKLVGLCLICPVTSKQKGYPFEVVVKVENIEGVVLCDQVRCADYPQRKIKFIGKVGKSIMQDIQAKVMALIS